jgi:Zn-dependent protease
MFVSRQSKKYRIFRLFGFPVYSDISFFILLLVFVYLSSGSGPQGTIYGVIFSLVALFGIIIHELGHALAVRKLGYGESTILLHGLGGVTQWRKAPKRKRDQIIIALAGPGAGISVGLIGCLVYLITGPQNDFLLNSLLSAWIWVNLGWSFFNLMPIWPMDGGKVVRAALVGPRRSAKEGVILSLRVSIVTGGLLLCAGLYFHMLFVVIIMAMLLYSNYQELQRLKGPKSSFYGY